MSKYFFKCYVNSMILLSNNKSKTKPSLLIKILLVKICMSSFSTNKAINPKNKIPEFLY